MTTIELTNPSAFHALRVYSQDRARNVVDKAPTAPPAAPKRETRAELEKRGAAITLKPTRITTAQGVVTRDVPTPLWQAEGADSLVEWVTNIRDQIENEARIAASAAAVALPVRRVVDEWGAPHPFESIPPHGKRVLQLVEEKRLLVEADEDVTLQISNTSNSRTIRLRIRDSKNGETTHAAFIAPAREYPQTAVVNANGKTAAVIELMPS